LRDRQIDVVHGQLAAAESLRKRGARDR